MKGEGACRTTCLLTEKAHVLEAYSPEPLLRQAVADRSRSEEHAPSTTRFVGDGSLDDF